MFPIATRLIGSSGRSNNNPENAKNNSSSNKNKSSGITGVLIALIIVLGLSAAIVLFYIYGLAPVRPVVRIEVGEPMPSATIFAKRHGTNVTYTAGAPEDPSTYILTTLGDLDLTVLVSETEYNVILRVVDTIPPTATPQAQFVSLGETLAADMFVTDVYDKTEVSVRFKTPPDFYSIGKKDVHLILEDEGRNTTAVQSTLYIFDVDIHGITVEAGTPFSDIQIPDFLIKDDSLNGVYDKIPLRFEINPPEEELGIVGDFSIRILLNEISFPSVITIVDTTPPTGKVLNLSTWLEKTLDPLEFFEEVHDFSDFTATFLTPPDTSYEGTREVIIILEDIWGNTSEFKASMTVEADTIAPEIRGVSDLTIAQGSNVLYREGVTAWDNVDGDIDFEVDSSAVDNNKLGTYTVTYTAIDSSGNISTETATVTVAEFTTESLLAMIDDILDDILDPNSDETEKARAIHRWVRGRISYGASTDREIERAAFRGLQRRTGDCFTFYAVSTLMLDRVGIENIEITRTPGARSTAHYWSLINIDGLWYHFDATPNNFGFFGFMFTSAEAARVSPRNYYTFDPHLYPPIV